MGKGEGGEEGPIDPNAIKRQRLWKIIPDPERADKIDKARKEHEKEIYTASRLQIR